MWSIKIDDEFLIDIANDRLITTKNRAEANVYLSLDSLTLEIKLLIAFLTNKTGYLDYEITIINNI